MTRRGIIGVIAATVTTVLGQEPKPGEPVSPIFPPPSRWADSPAVTSTGTLAIHGTREAVSAIEINMDGLTHVFRLRYKGRVVSITPEEVMDALEEPTKGVPIWTDPGIVMPDVPEASTYTPPKEWGR